jgi:carboxypeptidase Taq
VPEELVRALAKARSAATAAWEHARLDGDFAAFAPRLAEVVNLSRSRAAALADGLDAYDALIEEHEPGMRSAAVFAVLRELAAELMPLVQSIGERPLPELPPERFSAAAQWTFQRQLVSDLGFDLNRGRLDLSSHPFTLKCSEQDVRMTTHLDETTVFPAILSTLHELGHGLYDQGFAARHYETVLADAPGMGLHESQSRLWENHVGRSRAFFVRYRSRLAELFPDQLSGATAGDLYRAANLVRPSAIRITADELTYDLHILFRCELEAALLSGDLAVDDLPGAWNDKLGHYLGLAPVDVREGCLQDIHWAQGMFGFFPTYSLGNLYAAMQMQAITERAPDVLAAMGHGDYVPLLAWLRKTIHERGHLLDTAGLLREATGQDLSAGPQINYLRGKYGELYGIR